MGLVLAVLEQSMLPLEACIPHHHHQHHQRVGFVQEQLLLPPTVVEFLLATMLIRRKGYRGQATLVHHPSSVCLRSCILMSVVGRPLLAAECRLVVRLKWIRLGFILS